MTVGGNVRPPGNVSDAVPKAVFPVRGITTTGLIGSSVVIDRLHDFGPPEVGVNLTPTSRPESGLIVAGNSPGFTSVKSAQEMTADTTSRLQVPTLLILRVCGGVVPEQLAVPKSPLPVTLIVPDPVLHVTVTGVFGLAGSLLAMLKVADFAPTVVGVQVNVKLKLASGLMFTGKVGPVASEMSVLPEVRVMLLMSRLSAPVSATSTLPAPVEPSQTGPM